MRTGVCNQIITCVRFARAGLMSRGFRQFSKTSIFPLNFNILSTASFDLKWQCEEASADLLYKLILLNSEGQIAATRVKNQNICSAVVVGGRLPNHKVKPSPDESILKTCNGKRWTKSCNGKRWNRASHGETGKSIGHLRCCYQTQVHDETNAAINHRCMNINRYNTGAWTYKSQKHASTITRNP